MTGQSRRPLGYSSFRRPGLCDIPVVVLTTSAAETDMVKAYKNHANSYLVKPVDFAKFMDQMKALGYYWLIWNKFPF